MADEQQCVLCEAYFRTQAMNGDKCKNCATLYPSAKTKEEIKKKGKIKGETLSERRVKEIVYEILEEANLKRVPCEKCGEKYFRSSPASKFCAKCKEAK